jgi:hypothetical protein
LVENGDKRAGKAGVPKCQPSLRWLQARRGKPSVDAGAGFGGARLVEKLIALSAGRQLLSITLYLVAMAEKALIE